MSLDIGDDESLDAILTEVGAFGLFQVVSYLLISIPNILSSAYVVNYMISANTLEYRCKVPECDIGENNRDIPFNQQWLKNAIPYSNGQFDSCFRFAPKNSSQTNDGQCSEDLFDHSTKIPCSEFVYSSDEKNVQTEFNIHCGDSYKLALVGTINNIGCLIFLPLTGILSDRFGRLTITVYGMLSACIFGLIKSFSVNFPMYLVFEFLEASGNACTYPAIYLLGIEWVNSKFRVLGSTLISVSYPLGEILLGIVALYIHNFRTSIQILYTPGLLVIAYFWLVPESIRWLLVTGHVNRAVKILKRIATVNRKTISPKSIDAINLRYSTVSTAKNKQFENKDDKDSQSLFQSFLMVFKSKTLCGRFFICCYQWIACTFSYYGLSLSSTHIPGANRYVSFILVVAIEVPAILIAQPLLSRMKRRLVLLISFALAGISIISTPFIPEENSAIVLVCFLFGKAAMTIAFTLIYIFTAEQWPTNLRNTILNSCSMIGRFGSMAAPLTAILATQHYSLPALLFGSTAIVAAIVTIFSPETFGKKLPDTIEEAKHI